MAAARTLAATAQKVSRTETNKDYKTVPSCSLAGGDLKSNETEVFQTD
jgi:hypothetical protein